MVGVCFPFRAVGVCADDIVVAVEKNSFVGFVWGCGVEARVDDGVGVVACG